MISRRKFSKEFKLAAVRRIPGRRTGAVFLARVLEVNSSDLYRWHREGAAVRRRGFCRSLP